MRGFDPQRWQAALFDDTQTLCADRTDAPGLSVHRHSVRHALLNALNAAFPVLRAWLGEAEFAALAVAFIRAAPPTSPVLHEYGKALPGFMSVYALNPARPWCADLARLEWARREALHAADSVPLSATDLRASDIPTLLRCRVSLSASLRLLESEFPLFALWQHPNGTARQIPKRPQSVQVWRREGVVRVSPLGTGAYALVSALRRGCRLLQALQLAQRCQPDFDARATLSQLFNDRLIDGLMPNTKHRAPT